MSLTRPRSNMFDNSDVDIGILKKRAYNLRWATLPEDVIPLTAADPDFPCAPPIAEAIRHFASERYFCYGPPEGLPEFRESMAGWFTRKRNIPASPSQIFAVDSAAYGIYLTCRAFLSAGDEAIIFDPVDFLFRYSVESVGGRAVSFPIPSGTTRVNFTNLEKLITPQTKMICLCNPLNPTGKMFTKEELEELAEIAVKRNLIILSDEIWSDIIFVPNSFTSIASIGEAVRNRTVTITGFSKSYGLAGLRIGAVMASNEADFNRLMDASMHKSTVHGANLVSQVAAIAALDECESWLAEFMVHLHAMKNLCVETLNTIPGFSCIAPEGCYLAFADIRQTGKTSAQMHKLLLDEAKVAVVPGLKEWFGEGAEGYIRLSFATSREIMSEALSRIKETCSKT